MKYGEILVYSNQGSQIEEITIDNELLRVTYAILNDMNDLSLDEINLGKINSRYLSLKQIN